MENSRLGCLDTGGMPVQKPNFRHTGKMPVLHAGDMENSRLGCLDIGRMPVQKPNFRHTGKMPVLHA